MKLSEIRRGESAALEFKSEFPSKDKSFLKTVVAFANGSGGRILIGVGNDGRSIVGVDRFYRQYDRRFVRTANYPEHFSSEHSRQDGHSNRNFQRSEHSLLS